MEDIQKSLDYLCEAIRQTRAGGTGNPLKRLEYLDTGTQQIVRPIFEDGAGRNGYYDVSVSGDSGIAVLMDVYKHFIKEMW